MAADVIECVENRQKLTTFFFFSLIDQTTQFDLIIPPLPPSLLPPCTLVGVILYLEM